MVPHTKVFRVIAMLFAIKKVEMAARLVPVGKTSAYSVLGRKVEEISGDLSMDMRIILERILKKCEDVNWIHLAQDRNLWLALKRAVLNIPVP
jgi:hypothetical protein